MLRVMLIAVFCFNAALAADLQNFGVIDVGGVARFVISSPDQVNTLALLQTSEKNLALAISDLRTVGYDKPNFRSNQPLIEIKYEGALPIVCFNGKNLLYATPSIAQFHGKTQLQVAQHWASELAAVVEKLPYLNADNIRVYTHSDMQKVIGQLPAQAQVYMGGQNVCRLMAMPDLLLPSVHRTDIVHDRLLNEVNSALNDPSYSFASIRAEQLHKQSVIMAGDRVLITVTAADAAFHHSNPIDLAKLWADRLRADLLVMTRPTTVASVTIQNPYSFQR